eukprot:TRINITY_DN2863_c0_g1_i1.p1 TRINITY_DN2863_c0_g1~~TRINITY_DN2863_c0_g1_i1.p1  ORF type:complete len:327 (-),score=61.75 TRINITY_DN2863_c0_g1_i1:115-1095(-)
MSNNVNDDVLIVPLKDNFIVKLINSKEEDNNNCNSFGLNLQIGFPFSKSFNIFFNNLISELASELKKDNLDILNKIHFYSSDSLHITISTLVAFTWAFDYKETFTNEIKSQITNIFIDFLKDSFHDLLLNDNGGNSDDNIVTLDKLTKFDLKLTDLRYSKYAGFFFFEELGDHTSNISTLRDKIRSSLNNENCILSSRLSNLSDIFSDVETIKIPNIIHSTFFRFKETFTEGEALTFKTIFDRVTLKYLDNYSMIQHKIIPIISNNNEEKESSKEDRGSETEFQVLISDIDQINLVQEDVPYMHMIYLFPNTVHSDYIIKSFKIIE